MCKYMFFCFLGTGLPPLADKTLMLSAIHTTKQKQLALFRELSIAERVNACSMILVRIAPAVVISLVAADIGLLLILVRGLNMALLMILEHGGFDVGHVIH